MLQVIFGDDEHTAAEGPYARVLKTRKWLYLASAAALAVTTGLYNEQAAEETLKFISLPSLTLKVGLLLGLTYLMVQYALLIVQLVATYDIILEERFVFRRADELAKARERWRGARKAEADALDAFRKNTDKGLAEYRERLQTQISALEKNRAKDLEKIQIMELTDPLNEELKELRHNTYRANPTLALARQRLKEIGDSPDAALARLDPHDDVDVQNAREELRVAEADLQALQRQVPSNRPLYRVVERLIDLTRVAPPAVLAAVALYELLSR